MTKKLIWAVVAIIVIIIIIVSINRNSAPATSTNQPIKIGADLSLSGIASQDGESIKNGLELARADLKAKGVDVEVIYQDDKTEPKDTVSAIQALATQNVQAIIGPTWSYIADAGVPVADRLKLVAVMPANTSEYVSAKSPYAFFTTTKVEKVGPVLGKWMKENGKKRIALMSNQGAWYETVAKAVKAAAAEAGAQIVYEEATPLGSEATTMSTIMTKVRASNPDVVFAEIDDDPSISVLFKKSQELKINADIVSVSTGIGRVLNATPANLQPSNKFWVLAPKTSEEFKQKYRDMYKKEPTAYSDSAYDSLMLLVDAIQNRGSVPLHEYLKNTTNYSGLLGTYNFDENGDIQGGDWVIRNLK